MNSWGSIASEPVSWIGKISLGSSNGSGIGSSRVVQSLSSSEAVSCKFTIFSSSLNELGVIYSARGIPLLRCSYLPGIDMGSQRCSGYDV